MFSAAVHPCSSSSISATSTVASSCFAAMAASGLLDAAMTKYGGKAWSLNTLDAPASFCKREDELEDPISMSTFLGAVARTTEGLTKTVNVLFDVHMSVPEFPWSQLREYAMQNKPEMLPCSLMPSCALPVGCRVGFVANNKQDGTMDVLKVLNFENRVRREDAMSMCTGSCYALVLRPGPWALKKAVIGLLGRLPGHDVTWFSLTYNDPAKVVRRSQSSQWSPTDEDLWAGIQYINDNAPECDSQNQQYYWVLCNIKDEANTPISGWPEAKVRVMAQNKAKGMAGAQLETDFPLHTYSFKPFLAKKLLPLLYPLFLNFAFMFLGWPGVGKTPAIIIMMLAMGRYHAARLGLTTPPGWRRAKSLDNFRHRVGLVHEGVFLDDPNRDKIDLSDLKSFVTAEENQTCHGRYNDVKLAKNCCRAYASNDVQKEDEPENDQRRHITMEEFLTLLRRTFPGDKPADIRAVLKRTVVFVFGASALYLRLPGQHDEAIIHRIQIDDVHKDVLAEHDKLSYGKYKGGTMEKTDGFDEAVEAEQDMIQRSMNRYSGFEKVQEYITQVNGEIEDLLLEHTPFPERAWLPSSPESESPQKPAPVYREPLPGTVPNRTGKFRIGKFLCPPSKRARGKTPPTPWMELMEPPEANAATIQPQIQAMEQENSFAADEEAALHLET